VRKWEHNLALSIFGSTYEVDKKALEGVAREAFLYLGADFEVNFRFVSEAQITKLNKVYRKKNRVTDVLSFKLDSDESGGDVVICYKELIREAKAWKMSPSDTACFLLVHGILHLAGYDHTNPAERAKMEKTEKEVLKKKGIEVER
jgi:probable rRNA maturation factor